MFQPFLFLCLFVNQCQSGVHSYQFYYVPSTYLQSNVEVPGPLRSLSLGLIPTVLYRDVLVEITILQPLSHSQYQICYAALQTESLSSLVINITRFISFEVEAEATKFFLFHFFLGVMKSFDTVHNRNENFDNGCYIKMF